MPTVLRSPVTFSRHQPRGRPGGLFPVWISSQTSFTALWFAFLLRLPAYWNLLDFSSFAMLVFAHSSPNSWLVLILCCPILTSVVGLP